MKFRLSARVRRIAIDDVSIHVEAPSLSVATSKARDVLSVIPEGHNVPGVPFCLVKGREAFDTDVISIEEEKDRA